MASYNFPEQIISMYEKKLLESVQSTAMFGYVDIKENGYAFVNVSREFVENVLTVLENEGFKLRWMIRKERYPATHISLVMPREYHIVRDKKLEETKFKWKGKMVTFKIVGAKVLFHEDQTGAT